MKAYNGNGYRVLFDIVREPAPSDGTAPKPVRAGDDAVRYFLGLQRLGLVPSEREAFCALYLDTRHRTIGFHVCSIGTIDSAPVPPANVFRPALAVNAAAIILAHNHPSGDCSPSTEDKRVTERLTEAGLLLGIRVLDHIVIGASRYYSFSNARSAPIDSVSLDVPEP
jgi:DNA repair protein RadC